MLLPLLLSALTVSAAVCPRGFLVHPSSDPSYCLSVPGADNVDAESPYTLGVLVEPCMQNVKHQTWRWQRYHWMDGKDTIMLQNLAAADIEVPDDDGGPSEYYSFCVTSGYFMVTNPGEIPSRATAGSALKFEVCGLSNFDQGQSWYLSGNQIKGNPITDPTNGQQKEQCLDVRNGDYFKGIVQMWYCVDGNINQQWQIEPL